jgi:hypothetical protein
MHVLNFSGAVPLPQYPKELGGREYLDNNCKASFVTCVYNT